MFIRDLQVEVIARVLRSVAESGRTIALIGVGNLPRSAARVAKTSRAGRVVSGGVFPVLLTSSEPCDMVSVAYADEFWRLAWW